MTDGIQQEPPVTTTDITRPWTIKALIVEIAFFQIIYFTLSPGPSLDGWNVLGLVLTALLLAGLWQRIRAAFWVLVVSAVGALIGVTFLAPFDAEWRIVLALDASIEAVLLLHPSTRTWVRKPQGAERHGPPRGLWRLAIALVALALLVTTCGVISAFLSGPSTSP